MPPEQAWTGNHIPGHKHRLEVMEVQRCSMCFKERQGASPKWPGTLALCRGCDLRVEEVMGWLDLQGIGVQLVMLETGQLLTNSATGSTSGLPSLASGDGYESATSSQSDRRRGNGDTSTVHGTMPQNGPRTPQTPRTRTETGQIAIETIAGDPTLKS